MGGNRLLRGGDYERVELTGGRSPEDGNEDGRIRKCLTAAGGRLHQEPETVDGRWEYTVPARDQT